MKFDWNERVETRNRLRSYVLTPWLPLAPVVAHFTARIKLKAYRYSYSKSY